MDAGWSSHSSQNDQSAEMSGRDIHLTESRHPTNLHRASAINQSTQRAKGPNGVRQVPHDPHDYPIYCVQDSAVETIQVVLDAKLLKAADTAARRQKVNRSVLIRQALQEHLRRLRVLDLEERDRRGYQAHPQRIEEYLPWEEAASWPED